MAAKRRRVQLQKRKAPAQERARQTVDAILQAATYILRQKGYAGLTTNAIALRAGVNIASLYQYFPGKEAVFAELMRRHAVETRAAALGALREHRGRGEARVVRALVASTVAAHAVEPELHRIFAAEGTRLGIPSFETEMDAALTEEAAGWIARAGPRRRRAELALWVAKTAAHAVIHAAFIERPRDATSEAFVDEVADLVTRYLRARQ